MTDKEFHRNALIVIAVTIVAVLIWLLMHNNAVAAQQEASQAPTYTQASPVSFVIQGGGNTPAPVVFPQPIYNIPAQPSAGSLNSGNCSCGCDGGGSTIINYTIPGLQQAVNTLAAQYGEAEQATMTAAYKAMGYPESVFVSNGSPTLFSNALPFQ